MIRFDLRMFKCSLLLRFLFYFFLNSIYYRAELEETEYQSMTSG